MTQQELAEILDVSCQAVSSWERDDLLPEMARLKPIAKALKTSVAFLMEENNSADGLNHEWDLHDAMFSVDNMRRRVTMYIQARDLDESKKALRIMMKSHAGAKRKSKIGENVPYIIHPLMMACHAFALNIYNEDLYYYYYFLNLNYS